MTLSKFGSILIGWYQNNGRDLPWRHPNRTPYSVWVSEIMLQQTQVSRVIPFYTRFLERFPSVQVLADATWKEFLPYYQGLGYYARGRNMLKTAQSVVENFSGNFPNNRNDLLSLPGVGEYTADAILSFGYGQQRLAVDTNVKQVVAGFFRESDPEMIDWQAMRDALSPFAPDINSALMDFAALTRGKEPHCHIPVLQDVCTYVQMTRARKKATTKQSAFPSKSAQTVLILHENHRSHFSAEQEKYSPFFLPAPLNTRPRIKEYFRQRHGLELSVRPPRAKGFLEDQPTMVVFSQVLNGGNLFPPFPKKEAEPVWQAILDSLG